MRFRPALALPLLMLACAGPNPVPQPVTSAAAEDELALGERLSHRCLACHAMEPGRNTPAAPTLYRVVDRPVAAEPDYNYSPALRRLAAEQPRWSPELLDRFLTDPAAVAPGTEMGFSGLAEPAERRAIIAWLAQ